MRTMVGSVVLGADVRAVMLDAARRGYPEEVCGVLVGRESRVASADGQAVVRVVERVVPVVNVRVDQRERRYVIDAPTVRRVEREAEEDGLEVIGFYHTHPDHAAVPSEFDREHSWPWYTYIIVSVQGGEPAAARAWRLLADRSGFEEETIEDGSEDEA